MPNNAPSWTYDRGDGTLPIATGGIDGMTYGPLLVDGVKGDTATFYLSIGFYTWIVWDLGKAVELGSVECVAWGHGGVTGALYASTGGIDWTPMPGTLPMGADGDPVQAILAIGPGNSYRFWMLALPNVIDAPAVQFYDARLYDRNGDEVFSGFDTPPAVLLVDAPSLTGFAFMDASTPSVALSGH